MDGWMYGCIYIYIYMESNGYRRRRYDNLIQHKHVTVYAKVQVMQQRYMPSRCHQVPRMPRETKVDVSKCHASHATPNSRGVPAPHLKPSAPPEPAQCHKCHAMPRLPRQSRSRCHQVPRMPRETKMDVSKCHACHANSRGRPGATPYKNQARHQSQPSATSATPATPE